MTTTGEWDDLMEIRLEELGRHSWVKGLLSTLSGSHGSAQYRFVAESGHGERVLGETFPAMPMQSLDDTREPDAWLDLARQSLDHLRQRLVDSGWHPLGTSGEHWWSETFTRVGPEAA